MLTGYLSYSLSTKLSSASLILNKLNILGILEWGLDFSILNLSDERANAN